MITCPRVAYLASLPVLEWGDFLASPDPCRKRALTSPHLTAREWAILRPLFLLAIERGPGAPELEAAIARLFAVEPSSGFVSRCLEEWRLAVRVGIALERAHLYLDNPVAARLTPFARWWCWPSLGRCAHSSIDGRVIPIGSPLLRRYFPPLSESCFCTLAPVSAPRARRERAGFVFLVEEEVRHLVAPLWVGAPAPELAADLVCAALMAEGDALLAARGLAWPKRPALGAGLASRPAG